MRPTNSSRGASPQLMVCGDPELREPLCAFLQDTFRVPLVHADGVVSIAVEGDLASRGSRNLAGTPVYESSDLRICRYGDTFLLQCDGCLMRIEPGAGRAAGAMGSAFWKQRLVTQREFFLLTLLVLFHQRNLFGVHANSVSRDGRGALLVGPSGSGKTTLTVACLQAGWNCLSDDAVLLSGQSARVMTFPLRRGFSADADLANRFPELRTDYAAAPHLSGGKRLLHPDRLFREQMTGECVPHVVCFPRIVGRTHSAVREIPPAQALFGLLRQSPGLLAAMPTAQSQLATLSRLVNQAPAYQLLLGADAAENPQVAVELLQSTLEAADGHHSR